MFRVTGALSVLDAWFMVCCIVCYKCMEYEYACKSMLYIF